MIEKNLLAEQVVSAWLLIISGVIFLPGALLYTVRAILKWPAAQSQGYLFWERGLVIAAFITVTLGLVLLDRLLEAAGDRVLSPVGLMIFLIGTVLLLVAETYSLSRNEWVYPPIVAFVILAFLGQAAFGASLLRTGLVPAWVGWTAMAWNLAWLVILPFARPQNMYYPWLNFIAPLLIGIQLLVKK